MGPVSKDGLISRGTLISTLSGAVPREIEAWNDPQWAAVSVIFSPLGEDDWKLLLIKRALHDLDPWSGHMAFPGGRAEARDADLRAAAVRETREEIGIDLERSATFLTQLNDLQAMARRELLSLIIRPFAFLLESEPEFVSNEEEVEEIVWVPLSTLLTGKGRGTLEYKRGEGTIDLPCIRFGEYTIWGLTLHMITEMLELFGWTPASK